MEDDVLCDDSLYVPNPSTIRVKIYLPNIHPLWIVLKRNATVQEAIELTIRKSNALAKRFQRQYGQRKEEFERKHATEKVQEVNTPSSPPPEDLSLLPENPTPSDSPSDSHSNSTTSGNSENRHDSLDGLSEFLETSALEERSARTRAGRLGMESKTTGSIRVDDIVGWKALTLLTDCMAYELRMELGDGECDMDFPGKWCSMMMNDDELI